MKSICISEKTAVGCKKITYEVEDNVYEYVIKVLEGDEPLPCDTTTTDMEENTETVY